MSCVQNFHLFSNYWQAKEHMHTSWLSSYISIFVGIFCKKHCSLATPGIKVETVFTCTQDVLTLDCQWLVTFYLFLAGKPWWRPSWWEVRMTWCVWTISYWKPSNVSWSCRRSWRPGRWAHYFAQIHSYQSRLVKKRLQSLSVLGLGYNSTGQEMDVSL